MTASMSPPKLKAFTFRFDPELIARVDAARGDVNRTRWVQRALESALDGLGSGQPTGGVSTASKVPSRPVSSRAPVEKGKLDAGPQSHKAAIQRQAPSIKDTWAR